MTNKLVKSTSVVGLMTLLSRVSGLVRDVIFANLLGDRAQADIFFVAFRIPNFFRRIFAEGAFSAAFVPVYSDFRQHHDAATQRHFISLLLGRFALILLLFSLLGVLFAPYLVKMLAAGFSAEKYTLAVEATRLTFPYLFFISLVALSAAMLNTSGKFAAPAATPVLLNICLILAALLLVPFFETVTMALAVGVLIAGVVQLLFQLPFLRREKLIAMPTLRQKHPQHLDQQGVSQVFKLIVPGIIAVSAAQISVMINTLLASFLETGSISWLYYSDRLMEFPVGVFGIALATAILPNLSKKHTLKDHEAFSRTLDWALRWVFIICLPSAVGLMVMSFPIVATIYFHGDFTERGVSMTAFSLCAYAIGLLPIVTVKVLAPGYFARKNTKTPVKIATIATLLGVVFSLTLIQPLAHVGLALSVSLAACINAGSLFYMLRRESIMCLLPGWTWLLIKLVIAICFMALVLIWVSGPQASWLEKSLWLRVIDLSWMIALGGAVYLATLWILRVDFKALWKSDSIESSSV